MNAPTTCPPPGICLRARYIETRDGDTQVFQVQGTASLVAIRLLDCWCPEISRGDEASRKVGRAAKQFAHERLFAADPGDIRIWVPFSEVVKDEVLDVFKLFTFDRVLGHVFIGPSQTLNRMLVANGLASTTKDGVLGK